jgi:hypothetical protein
VCEPCYTPPTSEDVCADSECQTNYDQNASYIVSCFKPDKCKGLLQCYCLVG